MNNETQQQIDYAKFEAELQQRLAMQQQAQQVANLSLQQRGNNDNLIQFQLELDNVIERIEHLLRGHRLAFDKKGNMVWQEPTDDKEKLFNEIGVQEILRLLSMYLNRNTILSNYNEETINVKMANLSKRLVQLIYLKYEIMGLDTLEKRKLYPMIVRQLIDTVHSSYLRALKGGERESLKTARVVTQNEPIQSTNIQPQQQTKDRSMLKPWTW